MNLDQVSSNSIANSDQTADLPSNSGEVLGEADHAFSHETGLQVSGASRSYEPFQFDEFRGEALLFQDDSGPEALGPCPSLESSASVEGSLDGKSLAGQQSVCSPAPSFTGQQWVSSSKLAGKSAWKICSAGEPDDASNAGRVQSQPISREDATERVQSLSPRRTGPLTLSATGKSGGASVQFQIRKTSPGECNPERSQLEEEFSEPLIAIGSPTEWEQQQSSVPGTCKLAESIQSSGIPFQRAPLEEASARFCSGSLERETKQASTTWESTTDGTSPPSGFPSGKGFEGNATGTNRCSTKKDVVGQGQSAERDQRLSQSHAQQSCPKILGVSSQPGLSKSQRCTSFFQGSSIDERSPVGGCSLYIQGTSSLIKGSPLVKRFVTGEPFFEGSSVFKRPIDERPCSEGSSNDQGSFSKESPKLQRSSSIEGSTHISRLSSIKEPSFLSRSGIDQGLPPVQRSDITESLSTSGPGPSLIPGGRSGTTLAAVGNGTTSAVVTESAPSSPVRSTSTPKHGQWSATSTESTTSTIVGRTSSIIAESFTTIGSGASSGALVQTLTGISAGSSPQINPGTPPGSSLQPDARASVESPPRISQRQSRATAGSQSRTSVGSPTRATHGSLPRAASGSPSRRSVGSPSRATHGSFSRAASGSPSRRSVGSPSGATHGSPSRVSAPSPREPTHGTAQRTLAESPTNGDGSSSEDTATEPYAVTLGSAAPTADGATPSDLAGLSRSHGQTTVSSSINGESTRQAYGGSSQLASATTTPQSTVPVEQARSPGTSAGRDSDSATSRSLESGGRAGDEQHAWEDPELGIDEGAATPSTESAKGIKAIDRGAVHHICSGQVVVSLATAVKELVENSLDAGSSSVEVRLMGCGATTITVTDDGPGVHPNDYQALALKHHTSKLRNFEGLTEGVETFGFRGEALSSLCALSKLVVCTRHKSQAVGSALVYDSNGVLVDNKPVSRQVGTTVTLSGLFTSLPVRRREFERNIKKEYHKLLQVLQSYAIIATNVRLHVSNQADASSRRNTVLSTSGHPTLLENATAVFGAKQVSGLVPLQQHNITEEELTEYRIPRAAIQDGAAFKIEGLISSSRHGGGRSAPDRQFYFVNNRPCDPTKVTRVVNEVYRSYNKHQYPAVVLNIVTERQSVDVNLTPDKRQVLVHHEKLLLATLKSSLRRLFDDTPHTISLHTKHSATKINPSRVAVLQQTLSQHHTKSREVITSPSNTASPLLQSYVKRGPNTASPKQSKLSKLKQLCIASPSTELFPQLPAQTASQLCSPKSVPKLTSPASTPQTRILSHGNCQDSPLAARLALYSASSTPPTGSSTTQHMDHHCKGDTSLSTSSVDNDESEHCTADSCGSTDTADHHSSGTSNNNDMRATSSKRAIAAGAPDDELPMPVQKRPRLDLSIDANKENDSCVVNVDKLEDSMPADPEILPLAIDAAGSEGRVQDDPSQQHEEELICDTSSLLEVKITTAATEEHQMVKQDEPMEECSVVPMTMSVSTSRKSIGAHGATDSFLSRLRAGKKEPCVLNTLNNKNSMGTSVRGSLKKFLNPRLTTEVNDTIATQDENDDVSITFDATNEKEQNDDDDVIPLTAPEDSDNPSFDQSEPEVYYDDQVPAPSSCNRKSISVDCSLSAIRQALQHRQQELEKAKDKKIERHFHAKIAPTDNKTAEDELNKVLSKDMFAKMQILGQFNLGFIISRLHSDLFIIDQHATDEKFNFETLQQTCVLQHQPLITPLDLELSPGNEAILLDNLEVFITNGFQFDIDETRPFGHRVKLKSVPQSRNWSFGKDDVDELIFMLSDSPGHMCRPSRVRTMFASRACRKSVMVGTALTTGRMRELVDNMGKIEQPWNCPHGRPTVRHLVNLDMIAHENSSLQEKSIDL